MAPTHPNGIPIPREISAKWISDEPEPYLALEDYLITLQCKAKSKIWPKILAKLPPGYRLINRFCDFYSDVSNGGFWQYLGNKSRDDGIEIIETLEALRRFGLYELANLLRKAIAVLGQELPPAVLATLPKPARQAAAKRRPSVAEIERRMGPLDQKFHRMYYSFISMADEYVKRHPEEFIHKKLSIQSVRRWRG